MYKAKIIKKYLHVSRRDNQEVPTCIKEDNVEVSTFTKEG